MKKGTSHWYARRQQIEKLIEQGLNSEEIAERLGMWSADVSKGLKLLGLSTRRQPYCKPVEPVIEPLVGVPYIDENGLKVTRYPARYAHGAFRQTTIHGAKW